MTDSSETRAEEGLRPAGGQEELERLCASLGSRDYFEILKLRRSAGPAEIKHAFYSESRAYHPDRYYLAGKQTRALVNELYKRVTEAYFVLRDDAKRRRYLADISGPDRALKLRFTEASELESKHASRREAEEQIGTHPKGRQFFQTAMQDVQARRWPSAERNLKMALTYEPQNARYKEKLAEVQQPREPPPGENPFRTK
jgi:DnaJ-class molecular chaperone